MLVAAAAVTSATIVLSGFSPLLEVFLLAKFLSGSSAVALTITGMVHSRQFPEFITSID